MKKLNYFLTAVILLTVVLEFSSCSTDDGSDVTPDAREKFLGTWTVQESCIRLNYDVEIIADANVSNKVWMNNFALPSPGYDDPPYGFVDGNTIDIPQQVIGDNWKVNGSGTLQSSGKIIWNYYLEIGGDGSNCEAEYQK
nr:hypothetical protein [Bacteroidota bacterium]